MKNKFDLIIFDWDGTLADSVDWIVQCFQLAAQSTGLEVPSVIAIKGIIGLSVQKAVESLFPGIKEKNQEQLIACYSQLFFSRQITEDDLFLGVKKMLLKFKQSDYRLAVATGKNQLSLEKALQGTGLNDFFHITRCADQTASKPHPFMLEDIIENMGIGKERVVMVGDSIHDMQMAENAGIPAIAVSCGANTRLQLQEYKPLLNIQRTTELLKVL